MMFPVCVLLTWCLCSSVSGQYVDPPAVTVLQDTTAVLSCPDPRTDVTWTRVIAGTKVTLVSVRDGQKQQTDKRFDLNADNSLVINNVKDNDDASLYLCNEKPIYLNVTTKSSVKETQPEGKFTPQNKDVDLGSDQSGTGAAGDTVDNPSSDLWKVPVGIVIGAALVLVAVTALRFWSKRRAKDKSRLDEPVAEVVYEEIKDGDVESRRGSDGPSLYYCSITKTANSSTENKPRTHSSQDVVYSLVQNPARTGNTGSS